MNERRWNWHLWAGFLFCLLGFASYPFVFAKFPITRDIPWANYLLFGTGVVLLFVGLKRAFQQSQQYRGKIARVNSGCSQRSGFGVFLFHRLSHDKAIAGVRRSAAGRPASSGVCTAGHEQQSGFAIQSALRSSGDLPCASQRSAPRLLSGILVTVLQLRVTGYREALGRN